MKPYFTQAKEKEGGRRWGKRKGREGGKKEVPV